VGGEEDRDAGVSEGCCLKGGWAMGGMGWMEEWGVESVCLVFVVGVIGMEWSGWD